MLNFNIDILIVYFSLKVNGKIFIIYFVIDKCGIVFERVVVVWGELCNWKFLFFVN